MLVDLTFRDSSSTLRRLVRNFLWGGSDGTQDATARVSWQTVILPHAQGGLGTIDPEMQSRSVSWQIVILPHAQGSLGIIDPSISVENNIYLFSDHQRPHPTQPTTLLQSTYAPCGLVSSFLHESLVSVKFFVRKFLHSQNLLLMPKFKSLLGNSWKYWIWHCFSLWVYSICLGGFSFSIMLLLCLWSVPMLRVACKKVF